MKKYRVMCDFYETIEAENEQEAIDIAIKIIQDKSKFNLEIYEVTQINERRGADSEAH